MSVSEWYSGSDESGFVPAVLDRVIQHMDENISDASDIDELQSCLEIETNENWRSYIVGIWGLIIVRKSSANAEPLLRKSAEGFDILSDDFLDTSNIYCQVYYELGVIHFDKEEFKDSARCFLRCLPNMLDVYDELYIGNIYMFLDICFSKNEGKTYSSVFAENAVISTNNDIDALEGLMVACFHEGRTQNSKDLYTRILNDCKDIESLRRVKDFADRHFSDS